MNFTVNKPLNGHDEDAPAYADDKMIIVCDGLGGGGQNAYLVDGKKRTSAYLGSRQISNAVQLFLASHYDAICDNMQNPAFLIAELKSYISNSLDQFVAEKGLRNIVKGKSMQMLPSTLAAIVYKHYEDHTDALVISAGDSRAFVLTPENGLQQISKDDVFDNVDAFEKSATMTNNIRQDGEYHINFGYFNLPPNCILLVCTDGCFDYISTPMELEYRLEYSISKCGNLFEPTKDNLGEYFGNILVNSGLKDDCTMAGVILGYLDSEDTKNLFLKRALQVQEKYRNPCSNFEKESSKRKNEVSLKISELEKEVSTLKLKVDTSIKGAILSAFQQDISGNISFSTNPICDLLTVLKSFDLYQKFLQELAKFDEESVRQTEIKNTEYLNERARVQQIFKEMRFDDFVTHLQSSNHINFFNSERSKYANEYRQLQSAVNFCNKTFVDTINGFASIFEEFKKKDPQSLKSMDDFLAISVKFGELQRVYTELIAKKQELFRTEENLKNFYMENDDTVEQEFINAWQRKFSAYKTRPQYANLCQSYEKCLRLQKEIESCMPLSSEQKIERFKLYFDSNLQAFISLIKSNSTLCNLICGTIINELAILEDNVDNLRKYGSEFDDKKYALWMDYKPTYELFEHCLGGKV